MRDLRQGPSIDEVVLRAQPLPSGPVVARSVVLALPDLLRAAQRAFDETGGLHAAGLFSPSGELMITVPAPLEISSGSAACVQWKAPSTHTACAWRQSA